jgi:arsenate reductase
LAGSTQGRQILSAPLDVVRIELPLLAYFAVMWAGSYALGRAAGLGYDRTTTLAFTAAGNNFELAIAVAIATWGAASGQALAGVVGPLIEVPVLVAMVYVSLAYDAACSPPPRSSRPLMADVPEVLFVCVHNAGAPRWPPPCSPTTPETASGSAPPAPPPPTRSTQPSAR